MHHAIVPPVLALAAGIAIGIACRPDPRVTAVVLTLMLAGSTAALWRGAPRAVTVLVTAGWLAAGMSLGSDAESAARAPALAARLGQSPAEGAVEVVGRLREDAALTSSGVSLRLDVEALGRDVLPDRARGSVAVTVAGSLGAAHVKEWRAGRRLRLMVRLREPARYVNPGVPDHRLGLARRGTVLVGSVKSAALVEVIGRGAWVDEAAATLRQHVRDRVQDRVGRLSPQSAAIVVAVLIGDRAGLTDEVERRLQEAGTYHVIAISGGNIAVFTVCLLGLGRVVRLPWRMRLAITAVGLLAYGEVASGGSSVSRAVAVALVYLGGCALDQRGSAASALGAAALVLLCGAPLSLVDAGFLLTFGATIAILIGVPRALARWPLPRWSAPVALIAASAASELALLPVGAHFFARVTLAGLLLNLAAVPLMSVVQVGGLLVLLLALIHSAAANVAAWLPHLAAEGLVRSAALVEHAPWLTWRVAAPPWWLMGSYYVLGLLWLARRRLFRWMPPVERLATGGVLRGAATGVAGLVLLAPVHAGLDTTRGRLRVTVLDVGQGDATLVQTPDGRALLVDAGGLAGQAGFDIGERVVGPAVWSLGVRRLEAVVVTHGDPDHAGGVPATLEMLRPREVWEGIPVPAHPALLAIEREARRRRVGRTRVHAGDAFRFGEVSVEVLHPSPPDWERRRVRNDDSVVLDVRLGEVSIVLTGDISGAVEEALIPRLRPANIRVLRVSHHGSATSTSAAFVGALRPRVAVVSCGRENRFGHPAPPVIDRLTAAGTAIYRTDRDGAVTLETDGKTVYVKTAMQGSVWSELSVQHDNTTTDNTTVGFHKD